MKNTKEVMKKWCRRLAIAACTFFALIMWTDLRQGEASETIYMIYFLFSGFVSLWLK